MEITGLINFSIFSKGQSIINIDTLVLSAKNKGYTSLAITDINTLVGVPSFVEACQKAKIKAIIGISVLLYYNDAKSNKAIYIPITIIAKSKTSFKSLVNVYNCLSGKEFISIDDFSKINLQDTFSIIGGNPYYMNSLCNDDNVKEYIIDIVSQTKKSKTELYLSIDLYNYEHNLEKIKSLSTMLSLSIVFSNGVRYNDKEDFTLFVDALKETKQTSYSHNPYRTEIDTTSSFSLSFLPSRDELDNLPTLFREYISASSIIANQCNNAFDIEELYNIPITTNSKDNKPINTLIRSIYEHCRTKNIPISSGYMLIDSSEHSFLKNYMNGNIVLTSSKNIQNIILESEKLFNKVLLKHTASYNLNEKTNRITNYLPDITCLYLFSKDELSTLPVRNYKGIVDYIDLYIQDLENIDDIKFILRRVSEYDLMESIIEKEKDTINSFEINLDDKKTFSLINNGFTESIPILEDIRKKDIETLQKIKSIWDISTIITIYRKGDDSLLNRFILAKKGHGTIRFFDNDINKIFEISSGLLIYREQVLYLLNKLGGFDKHSSEEMIHSVETNNSLSISLFKDKFITFATTEKNIPKETVEKLLGNIIETIKNKPKNLEYAMSIAYIYYKLAYIKANYPIQFFVSVLNKHQKDHSKIQSLIEEARHIGIELMTIDINKSEKGFSICNDKIMIGFCVMKNIDEETIDNIIETREKVKTFTDLSHFCSSINGKYISKNLVEDFICVGAFDFTNYKRSAMFGSVKEIIKNSKKTKEEETGSQFTLFGNDNQNSKENIISTKTPINNSIDEWDIGTIIKNEKEACGFSISKHPVSKYQKIVYSKGVCSIKQVNSFEGTEIAVLGLLTKFEERQSKAGDMWSKLTIEDSESSMEILAFNKIYEKIKDTIIEGEVYIFKGKLSNDENNKKIFLDSIIDSKSIANFEMKKETNKAKKSYPDNYNPQKKESGQHFDYNSSKNIDYIENKQSTKFKILIKEKLIDYDILMKIKAFLEQFKGNNSVYFLISRFENDNEPIEMKSDMVKVNDDPSLQYKLLSEFGDYITRAWCE